MVKFRGQHDLRVDEKCRLSIPSGYRQALGDDARLVLVKSTEGLCLQAFTERDWEEREDKIMAQDRTPAILHLLRFQVASAQRVEPDGHGRVVVPPSLRAHAGLTPSCEVVLAGQIRRFEIWARDRWLSEMETTEATLPAWSADLARLGL